jgi:mannose-6-phosphate isomerase-like protein (cupin superfamily)
MIATS